MPRIRCYVSPAGNNKIRGWYEGLDASDRAYVDVFLQNVMRMTEWLPPIYKKLKDADGVGELRWANRNIQHRLLGFFWKGDWCAVVGCTHKGRVYRPHHAIETAKKYKKQIENAEAGTVEYDL